MDFARAAARAKGMLFTPKTEWAAAAGETDSVRGLYIGYIMILAALPAIAGFIKGSLIGYGMLGITVRTPIVSGVVGMLVGYGLGLVVAYVMALIIDALAPTFGGQKNQVQALKTAAYAWTAAWVAGVATIIPWLGILIILAGVVYSIYLLHLGLPHTMKCPPEKAAGYTAVSVIIGVVLSWIVSLIVGMVVGAAALGGAAAMGGMNLQGSNDTSVTVDPDSALGKLAAMGQQAEQASKDMEAAQKSGDQAAQSAAMGKMMAAAMGNKGTVQALSPDEVKAFLPDSVAGLKRENVSASRNNAMGMQVADASADYSDGANKRIRVEITDTGTAKGLMSLATALAPEQEQETDHGYEKTYTADGRLMHEQWDTQSRYGEFSVVIGQRFTVKASGNADSIDQLKQAVMNVDLARLESLKNQGVSSN
ncbi:MAG TPA: Yip1 family protein [Rhodanobacteraceae bacterium]|nr:Yip1 family protein [Rhodanobacteraceae bacterium]